MPRSAELVRNNRKDSQALADPYISVTRHSEAYKLFKQQPDEFVKVASTP
jgi:threonine dehydrogenase-like Zn-dependent dehydrogenase